MGRKDTAEAEAHVMTYTTPDYRLNPPDDRVEFDRIRLEEFAMREGRDVAHGALLRQGGDRMAALAYVCYVWSDSSLHDGPEEMVRSCALDILLSEGSACDRALWEEIRSEGACRSVADVRAHCLVRRAAIEAGIREGQREGLAA